LDGTSWSAQGSCVNNSVHALERNGATDLFVGGAFTNAGGKDSEHFAIYSITCSVPVELSRFVVE
jgi:hypothetical protein